MLPTTTITKTTCCYCGVGCGIEILKDRRGNLELRGDAAHPANRGMLCSKGRTLLHAVRARSARLSFPTMRPDRSTGRVRTNWNEAIGRIAQEFQRIQRLHGPDSVGLYISGQCLTEEYYLANKIAKGFLQTNNIDTNSRLCMSSAVMGYKKTLGSDAPPISYDDIEHADTFFIAGANPAWCHPILFRRIEERRQADPNVRIIVADPRRTASCALADLHLQLIPGTDVALFHGIARQLMVTGQLDEAFIRQHTQGWEALRETLSAFTLPETARITGVPEAQIAQAAEWLGGDRRFLSLWTMGLNQSAMGVDKNIALIQLSLLTGKIGKPGCGPFSLTGQPNAMGGREVGGMATLLAAHRELANPQHRAEVADFWGVPTLPEKPGHTAVEMFDALRDGRMKAIWIIATNPVASLPDAWKVEEALQRAQLVVVQDAYPTETTDLADILLPAATWLEKSGTMTNSDRRISLLNKVVEPPGEALPDTEILLRFARAMGWQEAFPFSDAAAIFQEHAALTRGMDIDISGLSHPQLAQRGTVQWPCPTPDSPGTPRLYTDGQFATQSRRAQLHPVAFRHSSEPTDAAFPLILTTGRIRDQWHTMTRTGQVRKLSEHIATPFCEIHPDDAASRGIAEGEMVEVQSRRGSVQVRAVLTPDIRRGVVFLPMHWGKRLGGERGRANNVTSPRLDPVSKEPDLKYATVQVSRHVPPKRKIVIVGAGSAALGFIEAHRRTNTTDEIHVFGGEPEPIYNRVLLPHYIDGTKPWDAMVRADETALRAQGVTFHRGVRINAIQREENRVLDAAGNTHPYDLLILATGSRPAMPYTKPLPQHGVMVLRTRADADKVLAAACGAKHIVINGAGLLGMELAGALAGMGRSVTMLQRSDRVMGKQLDHRAASYVREEMEDRGVRIRLIARLEEVVGQERVSGLRLRGGEELPCDLLIFATGVTPNAELGRAAGLGVHRGVIVNGHLQTTDPAIFAIGEVAEFEGQTFGTTPAAEAQASALAEYLRGNPHAPYRGTVLSNILKVHGLALASAGEVEAASVEEAEEIVLDDPARRYYQKCVIRHDRLIGVILLGDTARFSEYLELISSGTELEERRSQLLRPDAAARKVEGRLVCSCNQVGEDTIRQAMATHGRDLAAVCRASKAGTSCGSCKPEILTLLKTFAPQSPAATA